MFMFIHTYDTELLVYTGARHIPTFYNNYVIVDKEGKLCKYHMCTFSCVYTCSFVITILMYSYSLWLHGVKINFLITT